ncbi:hypothetical protein [Aquabacterium humicola]|uniref:hypothetical protein n=1 Tax=Aquabacterium humicola TaxID=3237377 RepID=UPI0025427D02|nr:hypothetical protein [Rubrivivax pictus]
MRRVHVLVALSLASPLSYAMGGEGMVSRLVELLAVALVIAVVAIFGFRSLISSRAPQLLSPSLAFAWGATFLAVLLFAKYLGPFAFALSLVLFPIAWAFCLGIACLLLPFIEETASPSVAGKIGRYAAEPTLSNLSVATSVRELESRGYKVNQVGADKWGVSRPPSQVVSYFYSVEDLNSFASGVKNDA